MFSASSLFKPVDKTAIDTVVNLDDTYHLISSFLSAETVGKEICVSKRALDRFIAAPIDITQIMINILSINLYKKRSAYIALLKRNVAINALLKKAEKNTLERVVVTLINDASLQMVQQQLSYREIIETILSLHPLHANLFIRKVIIQWIRMEPNEGADWSDVFNLMTPRRLDAFFEPETYGQLRAAIDTIAPQITESLRPRFIASALTRYYVLTRNWLELQRLSTSNLTHKNLRGACLDEAELEVIDFAYADLECASLNLARLEKANLANANLSRAKLQSANLSLADLKCAKLIEADLKGANVAGSNFAYANLSLADLTDVDLSEAILTSTILICAKLTAEQSKLARKKGAILTLSDLQAVMTAKAYVLEENDDDIIQTSCVAAIKKQLETLSTKLTLYFNTDASSLKELISHHYMFTAFFKSTNGSLINQLVIDNNRIDEFSWDERWFASPQRQYGLIERLDYSLRKTTIEHSIELLLYNLLADMHATLDKSSPSIADLVKEICTLQSSPIIKTDYEYTFNRVINEIMEFLQSPSCPTSIKANTSITESIRAIESVQLFLTQITLSRQQKLSALSNPEETVEALQASRLHSISR